MAFDSVFQGPPEDVAAPGTAQSPSFGIDVVNSTLYYSAGKGWEEIVPSTVIPEDVTIDGTLTVDGHSALGVGAVVDNGPTTEPNGQGGIFSPKVIALFQETSTEEENGLCVELTNNTSSASTNYAGRFEIHSTTNPGGAIQALATYSAFDGTGTGASALAFMNNEVNCINSSSGEINEADALDVTLVNSGSGTIDGGWGVSINAFNSGAGVISNVVGLSFEFTSANGTTAELDGLVVGSPTLSGDAAITLNRGVWIQEQAVAGIATSYALASDATASSYFAGPVAVPILKAQTVYSAAGTPLPAAATAGIGARAFVSDATANVYGTDYASGGSIKAPVYSDGTNWLMG